MSTAAEVDLSIDKGADFAVQAYWLDPVLTPYTVLTPMKMTIKDAAGTTLFTVTDTTPAGIVFSGSNGLIQIYIGAADTATFAAGVYFYDLFVTYRQDPSTTRKRKLLKGRVFVNERVTVLV